MLRACLISALALPALLTPALAETQLTTYRYACEGDVTFWVVYAVDEAGGGGAVVALDDRLWQLDPVPAASGARYAGGEDGRIIWWTQGEDAMLLRAENGQETVVMTCVDSY
ncbi:MAG: MliC family protein [Paracoccaceae bacterium]